MLVLQACAIQPCLCCTGINPRTSCMLSKHSTMLHSLLIRKLHFFFLKQDTIPLAGLVVWTALGSLCNQGWSWTLDTPASTFQVLGLQTWATMPPETKKSPPISLIIIIVYVSAWSWRSELFFYLYMASRGSNLSHQVWGTSTFTHWAILVLFTCTACVLFVGLGCVCSNERQDLI